MSITQEIKDRLDIVEIIGESVQLRRAGRRFTAFCPFHQNTRTPSFYVFPETQTWHCFGACAEGGDAFSFVMKKNGWDFSETLKVLAQRAGVELKPQTPERKAQQAVEDRLAELLEVAADYYHQLLLYGPQAEHARSYLERRSLSAETLATFKIGFALNSWDAASTHFQSQGYSRDDLLAAGLLSQNEAKGTTYDRFRNRIMIPIHDPSGRVVGFGARTLDKDGIPKYLNSPQTQLFDKSRLLFGLHLARRAIREARAAVIVEGYMDVLQAWQHGFHNVVAQMGTALTEAQLRLLKRQTKRIVIALDADAAGAKATLRSLEVARETLDRDVDFAFDARGLVRIEGRLQTDIRVATLPPGQDPDDIIRNAPEQWVALVDSAQSTAAYVIDVLTRDIDLDDPKAKSAAARQIAPLIDDIRDAIERDHYWQMLARKLNVSLRALRQMIAQQTRQKRSRRAKAPPPTRRPARNRRKAGSDRRRANFLRQCLTYPQLAPQVDGFLKRAQQPPVSERDFVLVEDKQIWDWVHQQLHGGHQLDADWQTALDEPVAQRATELIELPLVDPVESDRLPSVLALSVLSWRLDATKAMVREVRQLILDATRSGDGDACLVHRASLTQLTRSLQNIDRARDGMSALGTR